MSRVRRRIISCLVLLWAGVAGQAARADEPPLPLEAYARLVEETQRRAAALQAVEPAKAGPELEQMAQRWEQIRAVSLPGGVTVQVDHAYLAAELRRQPPELERLETMLGRLADELAAPDELAEGEATAQLARLEAILARPEFARNLQGPSPLQVWIGRLLERVAEFLADLLGENEALVEVEISPARWLMLAGGALVIGLALFFGGWAIRRTMAAEAALRANTGLDDAQLGAAGALGRAMEQAAAGDFRAAVRYLYLSSLLELEERGLLRYDRSKTNREYLASLSQQPELEGRLRKVVGVFDRVWYGYETVDEADYARYAGEVEELRRL